MFSKVQMLYRINIFILLAKFLTTYYKSSFFLTPSLPILFFDIRTSKNNIGSSFSSLSDNLNSFISLILFTFSN